MIKVYEITFLGKHFLRQTFKGPELNEYQGALRSYKEEAPRGFFLYDTDPISTDHTYKQHITYLEKNRLIKRDHDKEQEVRDYIKSLPKGDRSSVEVTLEILGLSE